LRTHNTRQNVEDPPDELEELHYAAGGIAEAGPAPGLLVEKLREHHAITQETLANEAGISKRWLMNLEADYWKGSNPDYKPVSEEAKEAVFAALRKLTGATDLRRHYEDIINPKDMLELTRSLAKRRGGVDSESPQDREAWERREKERLRKAKQRAKKKKAVELSPGQLSYDPAKLIRRHAGDIDNLARGAAREALESFPQLGSDALEDLHSAGRLKAIQKTRDRVFDANRGAKYTTWVYEQALSGASDAARRMAKDAGRRGPSLGGGVEAWEYGDGSGDGGIFYGEDDDEEDT
jgi:DNA-binding XRE family transcriptional regulator